MGLLSGSVSVTRFNVPSRPEELDFESARFFAIQPGSEVKERVGFVPMEPEAPYQIGHSRFAFRVRIDKLSADPTAVRERLKELIKTELETTGASSVGARKRKMLRELAEEELLVQATPRSKIIEGVLDDRLLYVASTAKSYLGTVLLLLRQIGVVAEPKAPWLDAGDGDIESDILETSEPGQSILGSRFVKALVGDSVLTLEPASGNIRLQTREARVTLAGVVLPDLLRYMERGAEILSARLTTGEIGFRFDALDYRINGLKVESGRHDHWAELLDERLEGISAAWELLDRKFEELKPRLLTEG
ncbi:MAG: hypothetical protein K0U98_27445 [Deltaproteobacteria bacterium]|nr:hypothetical protein [Deltaproteobacteria bacterium]